MSADDLEAIQARIDRAELNGSATAPPWELPPVECYGDETAATYDATTPAGVTPQPFAFESLDSISDEARPQIVQNILEEGSVGVMAGIPNTGKTFLAIHLGLHVAAGATWFGRKVSGGPVIYVAAEAPGSVKSRARAAAAYAFPGQRLPFYIVAAAPGLGSEADSVRDTQRLLATVKLVSAIEGSAVKLILLDTVASVLGDGEENSDGMLRLAGAVKSLAVQTGVTMMLIHHPPKTDPAGLRGHSSLGALVDTIISTASDENTGIRTATLKKSRDSPAGVQCFFNLEPVTLPSLDCFGDPRTTCIVKPVNVPESQRRRPSGKAQEQLLSELERRHRTGETHMDEAAIRKAGLGLGMHRNSVPKALKGLRVAGFVVGSASSSTLKYPPEEST